MVRLCTVNLLLCSTYVVIAEDDKVSENGDLEEAESIENVAVTDEETQPKEFDSSVSADLKKATVEMAPVRQCYSAVVIHHKSLTKRDVKGPPSEKKKVKKALLRQIFIKDQCTMKWNIVLHFKCFETAFISDLKMVF